MSERPAMRLNPPQKKIIKELLREIVLRRYGERCLRCGRKEGIQMSHIYSVGAYKKLEYDEDNIKPLCIRCHLYWWHKNPMDAKDWIETVIPKERLQRLKLRAQSNSKGINDYKLLLVYLKQKMKDISSSAKTNA